jgi:Asp-tRNA(Asn)/Glu-tRNA(Gln) amidotransferase A subunit family amidase
MSGLNQVYAAAESGAFVQTLTLRPIGSGPLEGLSFGVKDLIDLGGLITGCGRGCSH